MLEFISKPLHKAKAWMESYAEKPNALWALFFIAFIESSFFPLPPDVLLLAIAFSRPKISLYAALVCTIGSVLGGMFGYYLGYELMESVGNKLVEFYNGQAAWQVVVDGYNSEKGIWFLAGAAFTPIPYKIATVAAGATQMDFWMFSLVSLLGRGIRFFLVGGLIYFIGPKIKAYIDKYFEIITIALLVLVVLGFVAIKYVFK